MCLRCAVQQNLILALRQHVETVNKYLTSERNAQAARELREEINFAEGWVGSHGNKQTPGPTRAFLLFRTQGDSGLFLPPPLFLPQGLSSQRGHSST